MPDDPVVQPGRPIEPSELVEPSEPVRARPRHRRVTTPPPDGSDPTPSSEPPRHALTDNDQRLKDEKPPHY